MNDLEGVTGNWPVVTLDEMTTRDIPPIILTLETSFTATSACIVISSDMWLTARYNFLD